MKIECILCGMQTSNGKILAKYTDGVVDMLMPKSRDVVKSWRVQDSRKPKIFKTEQVLAYPVIIEVADKDPAHGGRTWIQNQTYLVNIPEFIIHTLNNGGNPFESLVLPELEVFPDITAKTV